MRRERHMREERDTRRERHEKRGRDGERGSDYLQMLPCERSKRSRVYIQNARVLCDTGVLKVHTGAL